MKSLRLVIASLALTVLLPWQSSVHAAPPVAAPTGLKSAGVLTIGTNFPYAPMEMYTGKSGTIATGADIDLGRALAAMMGLNATFVNIPNFTTIIPALQSHRFDIIMSSMNITTERAKTVNFVAYLTAGQSILVAAGNPKHIQTLTDLSGNAVAIQAGTSEVDAANATNATLKAAGKPQITIKTYAQDTDALQQLSLGRVVAELTDSPVAGYYTVQYPHRFQIAGKVFAALPYGIAIRKSDPGITAAINRALNVIRQDGTYLKILKKYGIQSGALK